MHHHLQQHVPQFLFHVVHVAAVYRLQQLAALINQAIGNRLVSLLNIPGTAGLRVAQRGNGLQKLF